MVLKTKMKCPVCEGDAMLSKKSLKLFEGMISLDKNPAYECKKCKESFVTGEMIDQALEEARKQFKFKRKIISTGGSLAITLPSDFSDYYKLKKGENIEIIPQSTKEFKVIVS